MAVLPVQDASTLLSKLIANYKLNVPFFPKTDDPKGKFKAEVARPLSRQYFRAKSRQGALPIIVQFSATSNRSCATTHAS